MIVVYSKLVVKLELDIEDVLRTEILENLQPVRLVLPGADWGIKRFNFLPFL